MRHYFLLICMLFSVICNGENNQSWFQYHKQSNTFSIDASNIHPAAFFQKISQHTGLEVQYDKNISDPVNFYGKNIHQDNVIRFLEKEFSTLTTYKINQQGQSLLTSIAILPKGNMHSDHLVLALNPVDEAVSFKQGTMPGSAKPAYMTRLEHLKNKAKVQLESLAQKRINQSNKEKEKKRESQEKRKERMAERQKNLQEFKEKHPDLYEKRKDIFEFGMKKNQPN